MAGPSARPRCLRGDLELQWHLARAEVGFTLAGARAFNDVYSIDLTRGRVERWTFSEMGGANPDTLPDAEIVKWKSFDGLEISGCSLSSPDQLHGPAPGDHQRARRPCRP